MKGNRARWLVAAAWLFASGHARAQTDAECKASDDRSAADRREGRLIRAQREVATCASNACPDAVRDACRKRSEEISAALPSVTFEATDASGHAIAHLAVTVDGRTVDLEDTPLALNPGTHRVVFTAPGRSPVEETVTLAEGDKMHRVRAAFTASPPPPPPPPPSPPPSPRGGSTHGPFYVQATLAGLNYSYYPLIPDTGIAYEWAGYRPDLELGVHVTGRADGLSIGVRQGLIVLAFGGDMPSRAAGITELRVGWDFVVPIARHELSIDPYLAGGAAYTFDSIIGPLVDAPSGAAVAGGGVDLKLFVVRGIYALVRPIEATAICFLENGVCALDFDFGVGAGIAFGGR